jgi:hypothetical protein
MRAVDLHRNPTKALRAFLAFSGVVQRPVVAGGKSNSDAVNAACDAGSWIACTSLAICMVLRVAMKRAISALVGSLGTAIAWASLETQDDMAAMGFLCCRGFSWVAGLIITEEMNKELRKYLCS